MMMMACGDDGDDDWMTVMIMAWGEDGDDYGMR